MAISLLDVAVSPSSDAELAKALAHLRGAYPGEPVENLRAIFRENLNVVSGFQPSYGMA
jgi:hypothetical protein